MIRDDIIRMARDAGIKNDCDGVWCTADQLEDFADLVIEAALEPAMSKVRGMKDEVDKALVKSFMAGAAAEREACAQMVMPLDESLADEIRARGETK